MSQKQTVVWPALVVSAIVSLPLLALAQAGQRTSPPAAADDRIDARLEAAVRTVEEVGRSEELVKQALGDLSAIANRMTIAEFEGFDSAAIFGLKGCESLREQFRELLDRAEACKTHLDELRSEVGKAPRILQELSEYYREQAATSKIPPFYDGYLTLAETCEAKGSLFRDRRQALDSLISFENELLSALRNGERFFIDASRLARVHPVDTSVESQRRLREQSKQLVNDLGVIQRAVVLFDATVRAKIGSAASQPERKTKLALGESLAPSSANVPAESVTVTENVDGTPRLFRLDWLGMVLAAVIFSWLGRHALSTIAKTELLTQSKKSGSRLLASIQSWMARATYGRTGTSPRSSSGQVCISTQTYLPGQTSSGSISP